MSLSTLLPVILNWVAAIIEALFVSRGGGSGSSSSSSNSGSPDDDRSDSSHRDPSQLSDDDRAAALEEARKSFGLCSEEYTDRNRVRRAYKKLSLRHHPDRNSNSEESAKIMARINYQYDLLEDEIDRLEGSDGTGMDDADSNSGGPDMEYEDAEKESNPPFRNASNNGHTKTKTRSQRKRDKKRRHRARQAAETERAKMQREMKREWTEMKTKRTKVKKEARKKMKKQSHGEAARRDLWSDQGRRQANADWEEAARKAEQEGEVQSEDRGNKNENSEFGDDERAASRTKAASGRSDGSASNVGTSTFSSCLHDIDDDNDSTTRQPSKKKKENKKQTKAAKVQVATNPVMEVCTDDIALCFHIGKSDLVIDEMQEQISERIAQEVARCVVQARRMPDEWELECVLRQYLFLPIDDDDNTLLHYCVYFGDAAVLDYLYQLSRKCGAFWEVFLDENRHGHIPLDYSRGRSPSIIEPLVRDRVKSLTDMARAEYEDTLFLPSMKKVFGRYCEMASGIDWVRVGNALTFYLVGSRLFQWNSISSLLLAAWAQLDSPVFGKKYRISGGQSRVAFLFALHFFWNVLYAWVYIVGNYFGIGIYTIGIPCLVVVGRCIVGLQASGSDIIQVFFDKLMICMMTVTEVLPTPPQLSQKYRLGQCYYVVLLCMLGTGIISVCN